MSLNKPASDNNPASDNREPLPYSSPSWSVEELALIDETILDARMAGFHQNHPYIQELLYIRRTPSIQFPLTDSLPPEKLQALENDLAKLRSGFHRGDGFADHRFRVEHLPVARARVGVLFKVGAQDVVVKHQNLNCQWSPAGGAGGGIRGKITELSRKSRQRMKTHARNVPAGTFKAMLTLTYPRNFTTDGKEVKRHRDLIVRWLKRNGCADGFWFLEFQERGAPHFHMYLKVWPAGGVSAVSAAWHSIIGTDDKKHLAWHLGELSGRPCLEWLRNPLAASAYVTKYASKPEQKHVPDEYQDVGRFWGYWGAARPVWRYVSGSGDYALGAARDVVMAFRAAWDTAEGLLAFRCRPMISSTMWGGAEGFDGLLSDAGWCPF